MKRLALANALLVMACSGPRPHASDGGLTDAGLVHYTQLAAVHVASCTDASQCGNGSMPPAGGPHCSTPLACRVFTTAQNPCLYVHNLEHGHLVMLYNCPNGCDDVVAALTQYWQTLPVPRRALVAQEPALTTRVAAAVWGYTWAGDTVDTAKLDALLALQDAEAPEPGLGCSP